MDDLTLRWRGPIDDRALSALHTAAFGGSLVDTGWGARLAEHSLGWVTATDDVGRLVGFVNVAWDGGVHAFLLDTMVEASLQRRGLATALVGRAVEGARDAGCIWLHVDFEPHLQAFYLDGCGFTPTDAGLLRLRDDTTDPR